MLQPWATVWYDIMYVACLMNGFIFYDFQLRHENYLHPYYAIHAAHNAMIVYLTWDDVCATLTDFPNLITYPANLDAVRWCVALHLYHILMYWRSFRVDDWLHHLLMIGVAIPVGLMVDSHTLMGFSLFFTTGLPGGIDYALLFGVRNGWIPRMTEKRINRLLNLWVRSPGCIAHAVLTCVFVASYQPSSWIAFLPAVLTCWNGQYFMEKVVSDYAVKRGSSE